MKQLKTIALALIAFTFVFSSCEEKDISVDGFTYSVNNSTTILKPDSAVASSSDKAIVAYANKGDILFEIYLSSISVGTYNIPVSKSLKSGVQKIVAESVAPTFNFYYYPSRGYFDGTVGKLIITKSADNKLSGTFDITAGNDESNPKVTTVKGAFVNIPIVSRYVLLR